MTDCEPLSPIRENMKHIDRHFPFRENYWAMSHTKVFEEVAPVIVCFLCNHEGNWWMDYHYKECGAKTCLCCFAR